MEKSVTGKSGFFTARAIVALALCSVGTLLAVLSFAAAPSVTAPPSKGGPSLISISQSVSNPAVASPVASGLILLRPSASIADLQSIVSPPPVSQTTGAAATSWKLAPRTEPIRRDSPHVAYDAARGVVLLFGGLIC